MLYFKCSTIELGVDEMYSANVGQRSNTVSNIRFRRTLFLLGETLYSLFGLGPVFCCTVWWKIMYRFL